MTVSTTVAGTSETRATSETGGQKGRKLETYSMIPYEPWAYVARVYEHGARKYERDNWRKGYPWSWAYDALQRHVGAFWAGETMDKDSELPHLAHAVFHCLSLLEWMTQHPEMDDRYLAKVGEVGAACRSERSSRQGK